MYFVIHLQDKEFMHVGVVGVNYKSSDLGQRELFARGAQEFVRKTTIGSLVLLSTCNRTEIYFSAKNLIEVYGQLLLECKKMCPLMEDKAFYGYFGEQCFLHLVRVISGLD